MRFRLVPTSSTLDDLERPICNLLQKRCVFWSPLEKVEWEQEISPLDIYSRTSSPGQFPLRSFPHPVFRRLHEQLASPDRHAQLMVSVQKLIELLVHLFTAI